MKPSDFFTTYAPYAMEAQIKYGIPTSITLAQAALESGWGESGLTKEANNFFGIKDQANDEWYGAYVEKLTREYSSAQGSYYITSKFRKYSNPGEGFKDHAAFLLKNSRYKPLFQLQPTDYVSWAKGLKAAGYATGQNYAEALIGLVNTHKLYEYDLAAEKKKHGGL